LGKFNLPPAKGLNSPQPATGTNPAAQPTAPKSADTNIWLDDPNRPVYPALAREGLVQVELPGRPGKDSLGIARPASETMLVRNVGAHIVKQIESAFRTSSHEAVLTMHHYIGSLQGAELLDTKGIAHLEKLARGFASADKPREFFDAEIKSYLQNLSPQRRG
jgi:hypothetical protein